jgi:hypothetical protein
MTKYTNRTCHCCGVRKPQPEMVQEEIYVETGKSKPGVSGATWTGFFLGDSKSSHSLNRWLFNTSQRTYSRKKTVWMCEDCRSSLGEPENQLSEKTKAAIILAVLLTISALFYN